MKTVIVSAFPACGKSYVYKNQSRYEVTCLDSDSSEFSWIKDSEGKNTSERNHDFPDNYIQHIKDNIGKVDIIFVSSHDAVIDALEENELAYVKVVPCYECKAEWVGRFWLRGNDSNFIKFISDNWYDFTDVRKDLTKNYMVGRLQLGNKNYISDYTGSIMTHVGNYKENVNETTQH